MMRKSTYEPSKFASSTSIRSIGERRKAIEAVPQIAVPNKPIPKIEDHDDKDTRKIKPVVSDGFYRWFVIFYSYWIWSHTIFQSTLNSRDLHSRTLALLF